MREVGFLRVMIGIERIKIEEEKVKRVFDWPTPKRVKNIHDLVKRNQKWN